MSCLDLLRQQACDLRKESDAASQKYNKSVERGFASTVEEGWELLSQLKTSKMMRKHRRYSMMCNGVPLSSGVTSANMLMPNGQAAGLQFAGTLYQRPVGSMQHCFRAPRAPTMTHQQAQLQQHQPYSQQQQMLMPQQKTLSDGPEQWTEGNAVPRGIDVHKHGGPGQQPHVQTPNCGVQTDQPATQQSQTMQRQMLHQQQHLTNNGNVRWMNANATPNLMALERGQAGQQQHVPHVGAQFVANNQVQPLAQLSFTDRDVNMTPSYANNGCRSSVFHTPSATPVAMRTQKQYASDPMHLQRLTSGNSSVQQKNLQNQFYSAAPNRLSPASISLVSYPPTLAPGNVAPAPMTISSRYQNDVVACIEQPQQQAVDVDGFFSLSEQELDEVLASLANSKTTGQQKLSTTNSSRATSNLPITDGQAIHISVPVGAEVLEVKEASIYPGAYEIVTTAGTFTVYG